MITQETYDEVVRENIKEFSMSPEEAIKDAIDQFNAQVIGKFTLGFDDHLFRVISIMCS